MAKDESALTVAAVAQEVRRSSGPSVSDVLGPTREERLAATEAANAARALDGHRVVHVDPNATDGPEK